MFGMGFGEVLLILAVALIVIGPKKLPEVARAVGRSLAELRRVGDDIQRTIHREIHTPLRDDFLKDLNAARKQVRPGPPPGESPEPGPSADAQPAPPSEGGTEGKDAPPPEDDRHG